MCVITADFLAKTLLNILLHKVASSPLYYYKKSRRTFAEKVLLHVCFVHMNLFFL